MTKAKKAVKEKAAKPAKGEAAVADNAAETAEQQPREIKPMEKLVNLKPSQINFMAGFNVRDKYEGYAELKNSIKEHGIKTPVHGYKDGDVYIVTVGHNRVKAAQELESEGADVVVPLIVEPKGYTEEERTIDLLLSNSGRNLTMLEKSKIVKRLLDEKKTEEEIATIFSESKVNIGNYLLLLKATAKTKKEIVKGTVSATAVVEMLRKMEPDKVEEHVLRIAESSGEMGKLTKEAAKSTARGKSKKITIAKAGLIYDEIESLDGFSPRKLETFSKVLELLRGECKVKEFKEYFFTTSTKS